jgi:predicted lipoprotein with Yx(FWY)xxD motif
VKRVLSWLGGLGLATGLLLAVAACGSTPSAHTTGSTPSYTIKAVDKSVTGKEEQVLTNAKGMTLYYYTPDKGKAVTCTGGCAHAWPPLTLPKGMSKAAGGSGVSGTFSSLSGVVTYNGWPLYTFAGDKSASTAAGQGVGGVWFVATPGLHAATTTSSSGGSGSGGSSWG